MSDKKQIVRLSWEQRSEGEQSLLLRGICQQALGLAFPKVDALNYHFKPVGLKLVTTNGLKNHGEEMVKAVTAIEEDNESVYAKLAIYEDLISKAKMALITPDTTLAEKLTNVQRILNGL